MSRSQSARSLPHAHPRALARRGGGPLAIERRFDPEAESTLRDDVRRGLGRTPKRLPPKWFYDARGSDLFDEICTLPEYYLTRAEQRLLERFARDAIAVSQPTDLIELGSGAARKTTTLLDGAAAEHLRIRYHPVDVCEPMLRASAERLVAEYPWLEVRPVVADYERHLDGLGAGSERRLFAFLGSTIGNLSPARAAAFLGRLSAEMRPGEHLLLGADLVKPVERLEAAYNDAAGVTARFNRNVLHVLNRELGADFDVERFEHLAFFRRERSQMEMHLRSTVAQRVRIAALDLVVEFREGETIHTEISRKFTRRGLEGLCRRAGLRLRRWYEDETQEFGLLLAERVRV